MTTTCIIIDDEKNSREALQMMIERFCTEVKILDCCESAKEGIKSIETHHPHLVFLDVEMPFMNGFDMLRTINNIDFDVIFTTAYDHYAVKAIRFSALDYLLKPIDIDELRSAIDKYKQQASRLSKDIQVQTLLENLKLSDKLKRISVHSHDGLQVLNVEEIVRCEADRNYTKIFIQNGQQLVSSKNMKEYETLLAGNDFIRVHHSHLININHLKKYIRGEGGQALMSDGSIIDVSRRKKEELMQMLK